MTNAELIQTLSREPLPEGSHGPVASMGIPWQELPAWDDLEFVCEQSDANNGVEVGTELVLGDVRAQPLRMEIPLFVSDMSYGSLSREAKVTLAKGAELAKTAICSGEGGILEEEINSNSRYMYEFGTGEFGFRQRGNDLPPLWPKAQAFHFKGGQAAKTGTGGHLPAEKVTPSIAAARGVNVGESVISPPTFVDLKTVGDFQTRIREVKEKMGDVPIGFKLSANRLGEDIHFALRVGVDYLIVDGRGGSTGAAPIIFRDNISIPTIAALVRSRQLLDRQESDVKLIITGGLRTPVDFAKALALGADGVALANTALQAIGCVGARRCQTNLCPAGIATQNPLMIANFKGTPEQLQNTLRNSTLVMQQIAKNCGHHHLNQLNRTDLRARTREMSYLTGLPLTE